jgi:hypothetical protein
MPEQHAAQRRHSALLGRTRSLGLELGFEDAGSQVAEISGVRPIDDYPAIADLSALQGPWVSHLWRCPS